MILMSCTFGLLVPCKLLVEGMLHLGKFLSVRRTAIISTVQFLPQPSEDDVKKNQARRNTLPLWKPQKKNRGGRLSDSSSLICPSSDLKHWVAYFSTLFRLVSDPTVPGKASRH